MREGKPTCNWRGALPTFQVSREGVGDLDWRSTVQATKKGDLDSKPTEGVFDG
jgi:hypothetical protein